MKGIDPFYAVHRAEPHRRHLLRVEGADRSNPELVDRFKTAMEKSLEYAQENPTRSARCSEHADPEGGRPRRSTCRAGSRS